MASGICQLDEWSQMKTSRYFDFKMLEASYYRYPHVDVPFIIVTNVVP